MGRSGQPHQRGTAEQFRARVVDEIDRRARAGRALNSGANRGDWLYAAAVRFFGSWGAAVEAAGHAYQAVRLRDLDAEDLLNHICGLATAGEPLLAKKHPLLNAAALRHFGSWQRALDAAGCPAPPRGQWTRERILRQLRDDLASGLPVTTKAVLLRNQRLHGAGRRCFGSWKLTLAALDPRLPSLLWQRVPPSDAASSLTRTHLRR